MPILTQVGRRRFRMRLVTALIYLLLAVGGITMVVPFVMTFGDSFRTPGDDDQHNLFPSFFWDDAWLYRKYVCIKHGGVAAYAKRIGANFTENVEIPCPSIKAGDDARAADYAEWKKSLVQRQPLFLTVLFVGRGGANGVQLWKVAGPYRTYLRRKYGSIQTVNQTYGTGFSALENVVFPREQPDSPTWTVREDMPYFHDWQEFKMLLPPDALCPVTLDGRYQTFLRSKLETLDAVNAALGSAYSSLQDVRFPARPPTNSVHAALWMDFVADRLPPRFFDWNEDNVRTWKEFIAGRFGSWEAYAAFRRKELSAAGLPPEKDAPDTPAEPTGVRSIDRLFGDFVRGMDPSQIKLATPNMLFAGFLRLKYTTIEQLNAKYHSDHKSFEDVEFPHVAEDRICFEKQKREIFLELVRRNYVIVLNYLVLNGRSGWVTLLLCAASILTALTINPLAAYALSRYDLKIGYQVLVFFLATMAFPVEVSMIPNFLMLKELGLLNTLWALFLPGAANGYSIFLLKGFFDSIPKEIFEAADLDGASEWAVFSRIVMPCSKPVLAVIALGAFTSAYSSFMWAFVVCQDPAWWTIMVYMFKLSNSGVHPGVRVAAIVLTSLPTFLVFVFCQKIILRGIVIPQMK